VEMLKRLVWGEILQCAYIHHDDRFAWQTRWLSGKWGDRDLMNGVRVHDDEFRKHVVRDGLAARESRDRIGERIDDERRAFYTQLAAGDDYGWSYESPHVRTGGEIPVIDPTRGPD